MLEMSLPASWLLGKLASEVRCASKLTVVRHPSEFIVEKQSKFTHFVFVLEFKPRQCKSSLSTEKCDKLHMTVF